MNSTTLGKYRWRVCALLFVATTINYIDRQVLGLLKTDLSAEFNWTETDYSNLVMAFSAAYSIGLLCFGALIDRIGSKLGYALSIAVWSFSAMAHGIVRSTLGFGIVRSILGVSEAGNFPAAIKATAEWFPKKERALATGIFNSGSNIAAVVGPVLVYWLARNHGWRSAFVWTGAIGFIWLVLWWVYYEIPSKHKKLTKAEYDHIHSDGEEEEVVVQKVKWVKLLGIRQTYAFVFGKLLTDPVWWFFLFWLPGYLESIFHMDLKSNLGLPIIIIYSVTSFGSIGGGWLSSHLIKRGWPVFKARKTSMLIFAICVVPVMLIQYTSNLWIAIALISLATAAHQAWSATIFTTASDMFPKRAVSSVVGIGGMAGSIGGTLFPIVIGSMLDHYKLLGSIGVGYNILFTMCGVAYLLAWGVMHLFAPKMERVTL
ncbi:MFS transporter, ACS family, hexuronate transporter [Chitinophaga terrae (ex Kim and Jung 2007)]|jgi:ACS family hexuronate transporter-like MFS transporter|uniref:MFS transporter, ACS family, hexuronate transporter n=1 Tax=Chitinophaga terrae (ex Kim and Jung 2007) TaxID=408074 RepID=A0A1H4DI54_9BACT|nr:MFS transporter [Chitinophaga terrae (ex Kim and Jung 2007)]GEP92712.1 hexuronate transporter [Chitinophaga terrae (ex Kim and Jung 2007)]SEA71922.1 MFS transporter, ACS family, hexuronate transporter [Chitinophaga terrae (ex Kim and Jung 2007)]